MVSRVNPIVIPVELSSSVKIVEPSSNVRNLSVVGNYASCVSSVPNSIKSFSACFIVEWVSGLDVLEWE